MDLCCKCGNGATPTTWTIEPPCLRPGVPSANDAELPDMLPEAFRELSRAYEERELQMTPRADGGWDGQSTFSVVLERGHHEAIGLDVDRIDRASAVVVAVRAGAVSAWNERNPGAEIRPGDRIVEVNGVQGDIQRIISKLQVVSRCRLVLQRPVELDIVIPKPDCSASLGLELSYVRSGTSLLITSVGDGLVRAWNKANKNSQVRAHDRIVAVNGVRGQPEELLQEGQDASILRLTIAQYGSRWPG
mmetsp:Transcript_35878/g.102487  ORF Transcript_35878/g.102487 Transcript_35878/m.102487 type:complete len:247 (+) Transcript_35878:82-822(+)